MTKKIIALLITLVAISACKQNPLPKDGLILVQEPTKPQPIPPPYVLDNPKSFEFKEGVYTEFTLKATVPSPGKAMVNVEQLPEGATFNTETLTFGWTPPYTAANQSEDPNVLTRTYPVRFVLRSTDDELTSISRETVLVVKDVPRDYKVSFSQENPEVDERKTLTETFAVGSLDFPKGPFKVTIVNMPAGVTLEADKRDPAKFHVSFTPDVTFVNILTDQQKWKDGKYAYYRTVPIEIVAIAPNGISVRDTWRWTVWDTRADAKYSGPKEIQQVPDVNFVIATEDINGETHPSISLDPRPPFGEVKIHNEYNDVKGDGVSYPVTLSSFKWNKIPDDKIGTEYDLGIKVCVKSSKFSSNHCRRHTVNVKFDPTHQPAPDVYRQDWPLAKVLYLKEKKSERVNVRVRDENSYAKVEIFPESIREEVSWDRDQLTITPKSTGLRQFNLVATSKYGISTSESFVFEALPWSWHPVLVLGDSHVDEEVLAAIDFFDEVNVVNPLLQPLDERMLSLRSTLIIGTSALKQEGALATIESASSKIKNILVMSPLLKNLEGELGKEIKDNQLSFAGRYTSFPGPLPEVEKVDVVPAKLGSLTQPSSPIHLKGKLTGESFDPMILLVDDRSSCKKALQLEDPKIEEPLTVSVICRRKGNGKLLVSGVEWGDIQPTSISESKIVKKWLTELVTP